jgi:hypothetical protein
MMAVEEEWKENKGYKCAFRDGVCFALEITSSSRRVRGKDYLKCTRSITEMSVECTGVPGIRHFKAASQLFP